MIAEKTVFILGAGASYPYGYPTGKELRKYIYSDFKSYFQQFSDYYYTNETISSSANTLFSEVDAFTKSFKDSSDLSIDLFLACNDKFSKIGKLAIMLSIFDYERKSKFREDSIFPDQDWYSYLYNRMRISLTKPDSYKEFGQNDVAFITFNYDRSLEYFLYDSLRNSFSEATDDEIIGELRKLPIYHVYGKISHLPWEGDSANSVDYRKDHDAELYQRYSLGYLLELKDNIHVMHERIEHDLIEMKNHIVRAKRIFFLGFGYAQENLDILNICKNIHPDQQRYGTAFGYLPKEIEDIRSVLSASSEPKPSDHDNPRIKDMDCVTLLREFL